MKLPGGHYCPLGFFVPEFMKCLIETLRILNIWLYFPDRNRKSNYLFYWGEYVLLSGSSI